MVFDKQNTTANSPSDKKVVTKLLLYYKKSKPSSVTVKIRDYSRDIATFPPKLKLILHTNTRMHTINFDLLDFYRLVNNKVMLSQ